MKIFIHCDLEGIVNIDHMDMIYLGHKDNAYAYENMAADVNAAVEGAFLAGAHEVTVLDAHGKGRCLSPDLLDSRVEYDNCENRKWWGKLDESYSASFFIGAHAMAGTENGFLDHTFNSKTWYNYYINQKKYGELGIWATICGYFNIPLIMMSGDEDSVSEARAFLGNIHTVAVKQGVGRNSCILYSPESSREKIFQEAYEAVKNIKKFKPHKPRFPAEIKLELMRSDYCDSYNNTLENIEKLDARTIRKYADHALEILFK